MMIADKPHPLPVSHHQTLSMPQLQQQRKQDKISESQPSVDLKKNQSSKSSNKKKKKPSNLKTQPVKNLTKNPQSPQLTNKNNASDNSNTKKKNSNKIAIPPRSVEVNFNNRSGNAINSNSVKRSTLKSVSDDIKKSTQDLKNLILAEPSLPNGQKPNFGNSTITDDIPKNRSRSNSRNSRKKSPSFKHVELNSGNFANQRLPDGKRPDFGSGSKPISAPMSRPSSATDSLGSTNSFTTHSSGSVSSYAGSSFHAEPKAVTLPRPSFLRK